MGSTRRAVRDAAREHGVRYGSAKRLPFPDASAEAIYSSHMLEHLSRADSGQFLRECRRVLAPGGIIRIAVPDLRAIVSEYAAGGIADRLIQRLLLADERRGVLRGLRFTGHRWMYDGESLRRTITEAGFRGAVVLPAGSTTIRRPGTLNLREREAESVYVEAVR
jgi:predicted SAM-dependent methyltransferase